MSTSSPGRTKAVSSRIAAHPSVAMSLHCDSNKMGVDMSRAHENMKLLRTQGVLYLAARGWTLNTSNEYPSYILVSNSFHLDTICLLDFVLVRVQLKIQPICCGKVTRAVAYIASILLGLRQQYRCTWRRTAEGGW